MGAILISCALVPMIMCIIERTIQVCGARQASNAYWAAVDRQNIKQIQEGFLELNFALGFGYGR